MRKFYFLLAVALMPWLTQAQNNENDSLRLEERIGEVVVAAHSLQGDARAVLTATHKISAQEIERQHNSSLLPSLTQQVPGLFITSRGVMGYGVSTGASGTMSMRGIGGAPTTSMLVTVDGVPQYMGLMGHPLADTFHSMMAESVEVASGPNSVMWGSSAMGGVINITTRKMHEDGVEDQIEVGYGSHNTLQTSLTNRFKRGKFTSSAGATYNRTDGHRTDMGFEQLGGDLKLGYEFNPHWMVSASGQVTHFNASNPGSVTSPILDNDSRILRYSTSLSLRNAYERTSGAVNIFYNGGRHRINDGYSPSAQPLDYRFNSRDNTFGAMWHQTLTLIESNRTAFGIEYQRFGGKAWNTYLTDGTESITADKHLHQIAGYIFTQQNITQRLTLNAGLRLDYNSHIGREWVPQAGIAYTLPRNAQLKASVSKGFRFPTIREMYMFPPQNPDLKPESIINYEISLNQRLLDGRLTYQASIFYINGKNIIQTLPVDGRKKNVNSGKVENWGVELQAAWMITKSWRLNANYSLLNMRYDVVGAPKHKLCAGTSYTLKRWELSSEAQYINSLITQLTPIQKEEFLLWNASLNFSATPRLRIYGRVENILNQKYEINAGYPMPGTTFFTGVKFNF